MRFLHKKMTMNKISTTCCLTCHNKTHSGITNPDGTFKIWHKSLHIADPPISISLAYKNLFTTCITDA